MVLYFAYGSNLDIQQMRSRCPNCQVLGKGFLARHCLDFTRYSHKWQGGVADVIAADEPQRVWGLVYRLTEGDLYALDQHESYPTGYDRAQTTIVTQQLTLEDVWVYRVVQKRELIPPHPQYLGIIQAAAQRWQFPPDYHTHLHQFTAPAHLPPSSTPAEPRWQP
jgi:gamma-glutamylcyclotransferase (GGCT)/AIG2-like uncharacterized protein YtfP